MEAGKEKRQQRSRKRPLWGLHGLVISAITGRLFEIVEWAPEKDLCVLRYWLDGTRAWNRISALRAAGYRAVRRRGNAIFAADGRKLGSFYAESADEAQDSSDGVRSRLPRRSPATP